MMYEQYLKYSTFALLILLFSSLSSLQLPLICKAEGEKEKVSNKVDKAEIKNNDKSLKLDESKSDDIEEGENDEAEVKVDPSANFKLIAVYFLNKEPRALIRSLLDSQGGIQEYRTGDYLDEAQTFSITRITLNPTARIEIIDQYGSSYSIKPEHVIDKTVQTKGKGTSSHSLPTYFSNKSTKVKTNREPVSATTPASTTTTTSVPTATSASTTSTQPQVESPKKEENEGANLAPVKPLTTGTQATDGSTSASTSTTKTDNIKTDSSKGADSQLGRERPKNPFEN